MKPERLTLALSLDAIRDDGCYSLPAGSSPEPTNLFFTIVRIGHLFIKVPTERGMADYRAFIKDGTTTDHDVRPLEESERFDPEVDSEDAHYLSVHRLQFDRLRAAGIIGIPDARFATLSVARPALTVARPALSVARPALTVARPGSQGRVPAIFQQRIPGATLWDMFDFDALKIKAAWQPFKATMAAQLSVLLNSALVNHIDWNIRNFVFHGAEQRLYYVDSKPTLFVARSSNDLNLSGIRTHFLA